MRFLKLAAIGAALYYYFDRQHGARVGVFGGKGAVRDVQSETEALRRIPQHDDEAPKFGDDRTLKSKIESEVFRSENAPKGDVNVDVELGVVYLRGQVDDASLVHDLESRIRSIEGVRRVENFLHTPAGEAHTS